MSRLKIDKEPYELELPYGIRVKVEPLTSASMTLSQSKARKISQQVEDESEKDARYSQELVCQLAIRHIKEWQGVVDDQEKPAAITEENIRALMDLYPVAERFFQELTVRQVLLNAAKNGFRLSADGTSAVEPDIVKGAENNNSTVPPENGEQTENSVPTLSLNL